MHSLISRLLPLSACVLLAACGQSAVELVQTASAQPGGYPAPELASLYSTDRQLPLDEALAANAPLEHAGYRIWALTATNQPDPAVASALELEATDGTLTISATEPLAQAVLYIGYDATRQNPGELQVERGDGLGFALAYEPGYIAVSVSAYDAATGLSTAQPLARLSFRSGAAPVVRRPAEIGQNENSAVRDLEAVDGANSTATLHWNERHRGDYDNNGEVNAADLVPIAVYYNEDVDSGDDIDKARKELIDGDENGEINAADIVPIASSFRSFITGYNVYRTPLTSPDEEPNVDEAARWTLVENDADPSGPSAPRDLPAGLQTRLPYTFIDSSGDGDFAWYVAARGRTGETPLEGPKSNVAKTTVTPVGAPPAGLSFEIQSPDDAFLDLNDELWIAVRVTGVDGLFSANVRFEYDAGLLEFVEGQPAYTDVDTIEHPNFLEPPLFIAADDVGDAVVPYTLIGFNATQTAGTPAKTGDGNLGYFKFRAKASGVNTAALRFPQASNFIYLWGETYGEDAATPALGSPLTLNVN